MSVPAPRSPVQRSVFLAFLLCVGPLWAQSAETQEVASATSNSATESLLIDVQYLASEELRGRSVTDETITMARDYIRDRMKTIGLELDTVDDGPFQSVPIALGNEVASAEGNQCQFWLPDGSQINATLDDGFGPLSVGKENGTVQGRVIFAGYGITAPEYGYDDYLGINAQDAIVIVLRKEPGAIDPNSPFAGTRNTKHAFFTTKIENALNHGAAGVLIVNDPKSTRDAESKVQGRITQETNRLAKLRDQLNSLPQQASQNRQAVQKQIAGVELMLQSLNDQLAAAKRGTIDLGGAGNKNDQTGRILVGNITRDIADQLLIRSASTTLPQVEQRINRSFRPQSESLNTTTGRMSVDLKPSTVNSDNVIGRIAGKGLLATETVVIGAHYDHVGMGGFASLAPGTIAVHNGADDNASGTAAMLSCAEVLRERLATLAEHRTVLLIAFTGEERGLVGSRYYVENPVLPIESTAAMINLDMVGRLQDNELMIYGTGSASGMENMVDAANRSFQFNLFKVASGYGPSDHQSFYRAGVPVLFFFTGIHNDYHRPSDDFDKIDFGNLKRITDMVSEVAFRLAVVNQRPVYAETNPKVKIRRQMTAYLGVRVSGNNGQVRITEVTAGGPADQAGLQVNDQIESIGNQRIRNTDDVLSWVREHQPGDAFQIKVRRNAVLWTLRGKLEKRTQK